MVFGTRSSLLTIVEDSSKSDGMCTNHFDPHDSHGCLLCSCGIDFRSGKLLGIHSNATAKAVGWGRTIWLQSKARVVCCAKVFPLCKNRPVVALNSLAYLACVIADERTGVASVYDFVVCSCLPCSSQAYGRPVVVLHSTPGNLLATLDSSLMRCMWPSSWCLVPMRGQLWTWQVLDVLDVRMAEFCPTTP